MLALGGSRSEARCARTRARAKQRRAQIERRLADLLGMRRVLETLAASCRSITPGACALIEALDASPEPSTVCH